MSAVNDSSLVASPLDEMVLGVQLEGPRFDDQLLLAQFWPQLREKYPRLERQPGLPPASESFEQGAVPTAQFFFGEPPARYWFVSQDDATLIQVQTDRLLVNWRRREHAEYPGYSSMRETFAASYETLLNVYEMAPPLIEWAELTYIDHLDADDGRGGHRPLAEVVSLVAPPIETLPPVEDMHVQQRHRLLERDQPVGRLYITAVPGRRSTDLAPIYILTMLARRQSIPPSLEGALAAFDGTHEMMRDAFTTIVRSGVSSEEQGRGSG